MIDRTTCEGPEGTIPLVNFLGEGDAAGLALTVSFNTDGRALFVVMRGPADLMAPGVILPKEEAEALGRMLLNGGVDRD